MAKNALVSGKLSPQPAVASRSIQTARGIARPIAWVGSAAARCRNGGSVAKRFEGPDQLFEFAFPARFTGAMFLNHRWRRALDESGVGKFRLHLRELLFD